MTKRYGNGIRRKILLCVIATVLIAVIVLTCGCRAAERDFSTAFSAYTAETLSDHNLVLSSVASGGATPDNNYGVPNALLLRSGEVITYSVDVPYADSYNLSVAYYLLGNGIADSEINVSINGQVAVGRAPLKALWQANSVFATDKRGNEIAPQQSKLAAWQQQKLYGYDYATPLPLTFDLTQGLNEITISLVAGDEVLLGDVTVTSTQALPSYSQYLASYPNEAGQGQVTLEAEKPTYKNDSSCIAASTADVNATPYDSYLSVLNYISGFNNSRQTLYYTIDVTNDGFYSLALNYKNATSNRTAFLTVAIDGEVPFGELLHYPLINNNEYTLHTLCFNNQDLKIYLTKGQHTLSVKMDGSLLAQQVTALQECTKQLNDIYLDLRKIAGSTDDANREWDPEADYPGVEQRLKDIASLTSQIKQQLLDVNGADANYQAVIYLEAVGETIEGLLKKPSKIANNYAKLAEGSGSIVQSLSNAVSDIQSTPVELDKIVLYPAGNQASVEHHGGFFAFWEGVKKFFHSFGEDYSSTADDGKTLVVWVARSRQYVDLMQQLMDSSDFYQKTGYNVEFQLLTDEGKLILSNAAGLSPDAVMGISNWLPYEMGIRELTYDLTQFDDYAEVIGRFSEGAIIPLIADEKGLGLPETQDFYVMYYRKDIVEKYGLTLPDTWDDVISTLPTLQRAGLNFYIPLSSSVASKSIMTTAPFIFQNGGTLFSQDGLSTTIDDDKSIEAIKLMTELYTLYALPQQVSNFFDSFRNGSLPIGISTFDTFVKLTFAAPEIAGEWGMAPVPGILNTSTGEVERWQAGSSTSVVLMDKKDDARSAAGWELLKWWTSQQVQTEFMNKLTMIYGKAYIWNSANLAAFADSSSFTPQQKQVILQQWEWLREIPRVPGWYMLERELSNAWNSIVINAQNPRAVIEDATGRINKELERKLTEFGYLKDGEVIQEYVVTDLEYVRRIKDDD